MLVWMTLNQQRGSKTRCYECLINEQVNQQEIQQDFIPLSGTLQGKKWISATIHSGCQALL